MLDIIIKNALILCMFAASVCACTREVKATSVKNDGRFEYREIYLPERSSDDAKHLGLNNLDNDWALWGHNLSSVLPKKPSNSIYAKRNGQAQYDQFCFMSDDLFEYIEKYIDDNYGDGEEDSHRFAILPNDNHIVCTCSECKKAGNTERNASPAVFDMIRRLCERFPNHLFFTSYYNTTRGLPDTPLPGNAGVLISAMDYPLSAVATPKEEEFEALIESWAGKTGRVYIWDYINNFDDYFTPFPVFGVMQRRLQLYDRAGVKGLFFNGSGTDFSTFCRLKTHILAALTENPDADWKALLKSLSSELYPVTGKVIADFMLEQEDFVERMGKALPLYEGVNKALDTYLPEEKFLEFYDKLLSLLPETEGREKEEITRLCGALAMTRLELMRIRGDITGYKPHLDRLEKLTDQDPKVEVYSEACWTLASYINDYRFMAEHADSVNNKNLLKGVKLTPLTALDDDYSDISLVTDGLLGLPSNYHCGNLISSAETTLRLSIPKVDGMNYLRVWVVRNPAYHIERPEFVRLVDADGHKIGEEKPVQSAKNHNHASVVFEIPPAAKGPFMLFVRRNPEERTMALDEIEAFSVKD